MNFLLLQQYAESLLWQSNERMNVQPWHSNKKLRIVVVGGWHPLYHACWVQNGEWEGNCYRDSGKVLLSRKIPQWARFLNHWRWKVAKDEEALENLFLNLKAKKVAEKEQNRRINILTMKALVKNSLCLVYFPNRMTNLQATRPAENLKLSQLLLIFLLREFCLWDGGDNLHPRHSSTCVFDKGQFRNNLLLLILSSSPSPLHPPPHKVIIICRNN